MTITIDLVKSFLKCPTKCFLRSCGEAGTENAYAAWVRTKNDVFRIEGTKRLVAEVAPDKCAIGTQPMGSLKPAQWHLRMDFAVQSQNLQCSCYAVEQIPSAGRGRTAQFVPIRFVFRNKLNRDDKLLLAFDARVWSEVLRREVGLGKILHGENYATLKVKTSALPSEVRMLTDEIGKLQLKENCFGQLFANLSSLIKNLSLLAPPGQIRYRAGGEVGVKKTGAT